MTPTAEPLDLPAGYGTPNKPLGWAAVRRELERATAYWLATVRADGRPHVVPLDGLWVDDVWFYGGSERSVHRRTALAHPAATMHLADPMRAVVVEGEVRLTSPEPELVWQGRLPGQAPEIDPVVYLTEIDAEVLRPGALLDAEIVGARGYDLVARPCPVA